LNSIPFDTTGQRIDRDGGWTGYEFSMRSRQVFVILQAVWPLNLLFDGLTDFHYGSSFRREIAVDRASTVVTASVAKPSIKLSHSRRNFYRDRACGHALGNDCWGYR
jgi:nucleoside-specific outer membrane channel protein Tsx